MRPIETTRSQAAKRDERFIEKERFIERFDEHVTKSKQIVEPPLLQMMAAQPDDHQGIHQQKG